MTSRPVFMVVACVVWFAGVLAALGCTPCAKPYDFVQAYAVAGEIRPHEGDGDASAEEGTASTTWVVEVRAVAESHAEAKHRAREAAALSVMPELAHSARVASGQEERNDDVALWVELLASATELTEESAVEDRNEIVQLTAQVRVRGAPLDEYLEATLAEE